jgi:hypothetical protein
MCNLTNKADPIISSSYKFFFTFHSNQVIVSKGYVFINYINIVVSEKLGNPPILNLGYWRGWF